MSHSSLSQIPWCARMLGQPDIVVFTPSAYDEEEAPGKMLSQDQLFKTTLRSDNGVPDMVAFYRKPAADADLWANHLPIPESYIIFDLGRGVNGFNGIAHGGFIGALVDEAMGNLIGINAAYQLQTRASSPSPSLPSPSPSPDSFLDLGKTSMLTAGLGMTFKKPIQTPQVVLVTARLSRVEGRRVTIDVTVQSGEGVVFTTAVGTWVSVPRGAKL